MMNDNVAFHKQRTHRIEALADGVCAIAMTLLVLDVRVPLMEAHTERDVWLLLLHTLPKIIIFIYTFLITGFFWLMLSNQFNYIHSADRNQTMIAIIYLLFISLLPFSASFLSEHITSKVALGFYILNVFMIAQLLLLHWLYCYRNGLVQTAENNQAIIHKTLLKRAKIATSIYVLSGIFCFFNTNVTLGILILFQLFFMFGGFIEMIKKRKEK